MTGNICGERFVVATFGESHGKCIGAVVDGCPAGLSLTEEDIQTDLDLRKPGQSIVTTQRREEDVVEIMSGTFNGRTTGAPIMMIIMNSEKDSRPYEVLKDTPRPGHADFTARVKYGGFNDYRGGGGVVGGGGDSLLIGGGGAKKKTPETVGVEKIGKHDEVGGLRGPGVSEEEVRERYSNEVRCPDPTVADEMKRRVVEMRGKGDSLGGGGEGTAGNLPAGL